MLTIGEHVTAARARLVAAGIEPIEAALDADVLARHALGRWERGQLLAALRDAAPADFAAAYEPLVARRGRREPTAYIIGYREFWNLDIAVTRDTLVPRPETELLVEDTLLRLSEDVDPHVEGPGAPGAGPRPAGSVRIADVCTGTGCLSVALARWLPNAAVVATDASDAALAVARRNLVTHGVESRVTCVRTDLLEGVDGPFDAIVSNPPYVPAAAIDGLAPEVREFEPRAALDGGPDGLDLVRRLVPLAAERLAAGGWFLMEFGHGQAAAVRAIIDSEPRLRLDAVHDDLAGIPRVVIARREPIPGHP
jgi:release factor glutamine methyltransferase